MADVPADPSPGDAAAPKRQRLRRTWPQRGVLVFNLGVVAACFATAAVMFYGNEKANDRRVVTIADPSASVTTDAGQPPTDSAVADTGPSATDPADTTVPVAVDMTARNFLVTGSDNNACVDPDSPYYAAFGDRDNLGERSDTIMVIRLDPGSNQAAVLSFPRDLWVEIAGRNSKSRINSAFVIDDPNPLIATIWENFQIPIDHYLNVDFCAFKNMVDAVGGVAVPFQFAVRDRSTNLDVANPGCVTLDGEAALAYVRSRHLHYLDPESGEWKEDKSADWGRISRQQDFLRRALSAALDEGVRDPRVANDLIDTALDYVHTDSGLTIGRLLDLATAMRDLDPVTLRTYQIATTPATISGNQVLVPELDSDNMQAILSVFRGEARLADAPEQVLEQIYGTTTIAGTAATASDPPGTGSTAAPTTSTLPLVLAEDDVFGIVPPADVSC